MQGGLLAFSVSGSTFKGSKQGSFYVGWGGGDLCFGNGSIFPKVEESLS